MFPFHVALNAIIGPDGLMNFFIFISKKYYKQGILGVSQLVYRRT